MYAIADNNGRTWDEHEPNVTKVRQPDMLDDIPEPPDFWTLEDFEDLAFDEVD